jgi:hypothetical protein
MSRTSASEQLRLFLIQNIESLEYTDGFGLSVAFPEFDLLPFDYLEYADEALSNSSAASKINCVGHLKRAAECEMDTIIHILNLQTAIKGLNFPRKLQLMGDLGIVSPRSVSRLNQIRNKIEHEYAIPDIDDLQLYYDLVAAFVYAVDGTIFMIQSSGGDMNWFSSSDKFSGRLRIGYDPENLSVTYTTDDGDNEVKFEFTPNSLPDFMFALRTHFLLCRAQHLVSGAFVVSQLKQVVS